MTKLSDQLKRATAFDVGALEDAHANKKVRTIVEVASFENARLAPILEALGRLADAAEGCMWINDCRCDVAYTSRQMHEPNALCGEMDELKQALVELRDQQKSDRALIEKLAYRLHMIASDKTPDSFVLDQNPSWRQIVADNTIHEVREILSAITEWQKGRGE